MGSRQRADHSSAIPTPCSASRRWSARASAGYARSS